MNRFMIQNMDIKKPPGDLPGGASNGLAFASAKKGLASARARRIKPAIKA
jgi:hypothetical protein